VSAPAIAGRGESPPSAARAPIDALPLPWSTNCVSAAHAPPSSSGDWPIANCCKTLSARWVDSSFPRLRDLHQRLDRFLAESIQLVRGRLPPRKMIAVELFQPIFNRPARPDGLPRAIARQRTESRKMPAAVAMIGRRRSTVFAMAGFTFAFATEMRRPSTRQRLPRRGMRSDDSTPSKQSQATRFSRSNRFSSDHSWSLIPFCCFAIKTGFSDGSLYIFNWRNIS
jgi:hypothetical protein